ncbi:CocE/NonD family hydrolase [Altererythrobacter salegens]|uniref:CocE/NonD family hydrolase n=1 Tax=Croceibacterium salegens TaxID=1737568 RepID=A0A6I4SYY6_9SPHN|nr:CocE/NonD family hydrolase [Croceibacterium salegens]MXO60648.1 CocE/NonD family hydrolase [Croceibacterium salegens]
MAILIERDVTCEMRDGTVLRANVFRDPQAGPAPVLLFRTPYDKNAGAITYMALDPMRAVEAGYVVVQQDTRGRGTSEGVHTPWLDEFEDGYDSVEWAASQPWANGKVGAYGISYHGLTAWAAAVMAPPSLRAIAPSQAPCDLFDAFWRQGAFELGTFTQWALRVMGPTELLRARRSSPAEERGAEFLRLIDELDKYEELVRSLPLCAMAPCASHEPYFSFIADTLEHRTPDDFLSDRSVSGRHAEVQVPVMITAGWHDVLLRSDLAHYSAMATRVAGTETKLPVQLTIGPWVHGQGMHLSAGGEVDYGYRASGLSMDLTEDLTTYHLRWFDRWLKDKEHPATAPVRIFVMGINHWRDEQEWPLERAKLTPWFFHGDGSLSPESPTVGSEPRSFEFDPADPLPTLGGATLMPTIYPKGAIAQNQLHGRSDLLLYTSAPLDEPLEVTGPISVRLWASTSARDADWVIKLCDVHPEGRSFSVCDGIVRASRRSRDWREPRPLTPHDIVEYEIDLAATSMVFLPGHRMQVLVTSSDFPRYDRNPGTGELGLDAAQLKSAVQIIYGDAEHRSHILLPVIPQRER